MNGETAIEREFDAQGRERARRAAGANHQSQVWDRYDCLVKRRWQANPNDQASATSRTWRYHWDAESRLEAYTDTDEGERRFQRDPQGQLTGENDQRFAYDHGGNRLPDEAAELERDRLTRTRETERHYDALGAETAVLGGVSPEYRHYDAEGQLIELRREGLRVQYGTDALSRRTWRKSEAGTTAYLWHGDALLGEHRPDGTWQYYIRDPKTDAPLLTLINGTPYYYELDWRGMPIRLWSEEGSLVWQANADAWGHCDPDTPNGPIHQPIRLQGQFEDELTGIYHNRFRDYDPATGRYLTPDPLGIKGGLNSYRYTPNPVDYSDPLGLDYETVVTPSNADKGEKAPLENVRAPAMSELPETEGEAVGLKKNADGDLILCLGEEACADPSNVANAGWGDMAAWGAMMALERVPVGRVLDKVPVPGAIKNKFGKNADEAADAARKNLDRLPETEVPPFKPYNKKYEALSDADKKAYLQEYNRQLKRQEEAINSMSADEFKAARDAYAGTGRNPLAEKMQGTYRERFKKRVSTNIFDSLNRKNKALPKDQRLSQKEMRQQAKERADQIADKLAALHEPDMVAGGYHDPMPSGMGRSDINSAIGSSWKQSGRLEAMEEAADAAVANGQGAAKMNVRLEMARGY